MSFHKPHLWCFMFSVTIVFWVVPTAHEKLKGNQLFSSCRAFRNCDLPCPLISHRDVITKSVTMGQENRALLGSVRGGCVSLAKTFPSPDFNLTYVMFRVMLSMIIITMAISISGVLPVLSVLGFASAHLFLSTALE